MDPDSNLEEQLSLVASLNDLWDSCPEDGEFTDEMKDEIVHDALRLAELVEALDQGIRNGCGLPKQWEKPTTP